MKDHLIESNQKYKSFFFFSQALTQTAFTHTRALAEALMPRILYTGNLEIFHIPAFTQSSIYKIPSAHRAITQRCFFTESRSRAKAFRTSNVSYTQQLLHSKHTFAHGCIYTQKPVRKKYAEELLHRKAFTDR